jgi:hypothetical protein
MENLFVDLDAPYYLKIRHGTLFYCLGFGGKVLLIPAACVILQSGLTRVLFWWKEKNNRLQFLVDFVNFKTSEIMTIEVKESFIWKLRMYYIISTKSSYLSFVSSVIITIMMGIYSAYPNPTMTNCIIWAIWTIHQVILIWFVVPDFMILGSFWFILRTHVLLLTKQVFVELEELRKNSQSKQFKKRNAVINKYFQRWYQRYQAVKRVLRDFDDFSKTFLLILNSTSSIMSSAFLFAILQTDQIIIRFLLTPILICFTTTVMFLLFTATSISSLGKCLYKSLNQSTVRLQQELSIENRVLLKYLIEETGNQRYPGISLKTVSGTPYESMSFAEFVVSFITLFLIMIDFLHQVF